MKLVRAANPAADVHLRRSAGGVFEITVDGRLMFSKQAEGRFPTDPEIVAALRR